MNGGLLIAYVIGVPVAIGIALVVTWVMVGALAAGTISTIRRLHRRRIGENGRL